MRRTTTAVALAAALCLALWGATIASAGNTLSTSLIGWEERPGPGDPDGTGNIELTLHQGRGEICFELILTGIDAPTAGHIHKAPAGEFGDVFVPLFGSEGPGAKCVTATKAQIREIKKNPEMFYVNVHNAAYPAGALRGQLGD